jgi:hypothetical protein
MMIDDHVMVQYRTVAYFEAINSHIDCDILVIAVPTIELPSKTT